MKLPAFLVRFARPSLPPMICRMIFDEICVLANGDIVCSCHDSAGKQVYGNVYRDRITDIYNGPLYQDLRCWQLTAKPDAWCPVLQAECSGRISRATSRDGLAGRVVRKLQLVPTSYCNLKCPACPVTHFHTDPGFRDDRANILPLEVMLRVVEQLPDLEPGEYTLELGLVRELLTWFSDRGVPPFKFAVRVGDSTTPSPH